jgi:hypothetical protein
MSHGDALQEPTLAPMSSQPYLLFFVQAHKDVLVPELRSIVKFYSFAFDITSKSDPSRPLSVLALGQSERL